MRVWTAWVLLAAGLAGCFGSDDSGTGDGGDAGAATSTGGPSAASAWVNATFGTDPVSVLETFSGTIPAADAWTPTGPPRSVLGAPPESVRTHDVSGLVPDGVPTWIQATIDVEMTQDGDVDLWFQSSEIGLFWTYRCDCPYGGTNIVQAVVLDPGGADLSIGIMYDMPDGTADLDYDIQFLAAHAPGVLPTGAPAGIELPVPGSQIILELAGDSAPTLVQIFDPQDRLVATPAFEAGRAVFTLGEADPPGEYVVLLKQQFGTAAWVRAAIPGVDADVALRPMTQRIVAGPVHDVADGGGSWTIVSEGHPIQAGFCFGGGTLIDPSGTLTGPNGELASFAFDTVAAMQSLPQPYIPLGFGWCNFTPVGDERLVAGEYTLEARQEHSDGSATIQDYMVYYER